MKDPEIVVSAPGRICLFGEHQDYFGLPVIAGAIDLRITISGVKTRQKTLFLELPDIDDEESIDLESEIAYNKERDYLKSAVNILRRKGVHLSSGWHCRIEGTVPINSGTASSSALVVAWNKFLLDAAGDANQPAPETIAELSFEAEVAEFNEPGGRMDHYASALGGIVCLHFEDGLRVKSIKSPLHEFVLADSLVRKNTTGTLGFIKGHVLEGIGTIREKIGDFSLRSSLTERIEDEIAALDPVIRRLLKGTLLTRDLTARGEELFAQKEFDHLKFGRLLTLQHEVLRDHIQVSLPKIDRMIDASIAAGALGAKINGSGQGGCIFAYAPGKAAAVADALRKMGTSPYIIRIDDGVRRQ